MYAYRKKQLTKRNENSKSLSQKIKNFIFGDRHLQVASLQDAVNSRYTKNRAQMTIMV